MLERRKISVFGVVQGIGFRPFIYNLANERNLTGYVLNDGRGVIIELQGDGGELDSFEKHLTTDLPSGGHIERSETMVLEPLPGDSEFAIRASAQSDELAVSLVPDRFVCSDCLREMRDPVDRRYGYPFTNCTRCGPRYTITLSLPYDRPGTTMAGFEMCEECETEYSDPADRRYHAQPIACPNCGPSLLFSKEGVSVEEAAKLLNEGGMVAVKGIGGFHLAVDARNEEASGRLRNLKNRPTKPLALMARDMEVIRKTVLLDEEAEELLLSPAAPIVLAPMQPGLGLSKWVAPGLDSLGVMLPYSPLHHLLFDNGPDLLVMTSGNRQSEPITIDNDDACASLDADAYLLHNREIHVACDDSVVRSTFNGPVFIRRSRGYVPDPIHAVGLPEKSVLALGAQLKVTIATLNSSQLVVGRHLGDLDNPRAEQAFEQEVTRMLDFGRIEPEAVALDLHPDVSSREFAKEHFGEIRHFGIQHHHAHLASVMAEHGLGMDERVAGIILDGFGYGTDGAIWGGELLVGGYLEFERVGHLRYVPQPGGDKAAIEPSRMATSLTVDAGIGERIPGYDQQIAKICHIDSVSPPTSSAGRLFDGVAAMLGVAPAVQTYEGEAAARLEAVTDLDHVDAYPLPINGDELDTRVLVSALVDDGADLRIRAARFQNGLADGFSKMALKTGCEKVVLGGGCMVNRILLRRFISNLEAAGVKVLHAQRLPPGDGGISAGQAACAACALS